MGFRMRKSIKICKGVKLNVSKSGISTSVKVGNVTYNTKRGTTVNLGNGLSYHSSNKKHTNSRNVNQNINRATYQNIKTHTIENKWDKMTDKQIKIYNIFMKILLGMLSILSLILTLAIPLAIIVSVVSGIIAYKFDAKKMQSKCKNNEVTQDVLVDDEIDDNSLNNGILLATEKEEQAKVNYEINEDGYILRKYSKVYSISYTQKFNEIDIEGYKILNKDMNVVGGWYRKENVNEFFDAIKNIQEPELDIVLEKEPDNQYDRNAIKVCAIYKVENEIRKIQIGYLSKEDAYELKDIEDLKASIINLDRLEYNATTINLWVNENRYRNIIEERELKLKQQEEYKKELEKIQKKSKISYEYNQLAMQLEKEGDIEGAIENYEKCIELKFEGNHPYDRLAILYRKIKDYDNEIRVLNQAIELFEFLEKATSRMDVLPKLEKFKTRLNRANELRNKKVKQK